MSSQDISVSLENRSQVGKGLNKLKAQGIVPAVIHNPGNDSIIVSGSYVDLVKVYNQAGKRQPVNVKLGDTTYLTIIKDADFDPKKNKLRHMVFGIIKQNEKVETEVEIILEGDSPAAKLGLVLNQQLDDIKLEAFPRDLPDSITVNIESLKEVGDRITVADIVVPNGVTILTEPEHPVVTVEEKQLIVEEPPEEPEATATETEAPAEEKES